MKLKRELLKIFKYYTLSRGEYQVKADVLSFPKMLYFLSGAVFNGELLALKIITSIK